MEANKIVEIMSKIETLPYQKILFDGPWGIGKTKFVKEAIEVKPNAYYISIFGKKDIDSVYQELYYHLISKHKELISKFREKIADIDFSAMGISVSTPIMYDVVDSINKELGKGNEILIVIDDLERKEKDFSLREIFGFVDAITIHTNVKVVLVASSDNFTVETEKVYKDYAEKVIERSYKIIQHSRDAPESILGKDLYSVLYESFWDENMQNLRTLEKTRNFVEEVLNDLPSELFNEKITREDIYKICFAVVLFVVEDQSEMKRLPDSDADGRLDYRDVYRNNIPGYIERFIMKYNLENSAVNRFIPAILNLYLYGSFLEQDIQEESKQVETQINKKTPFFMSEEQVKQEIENIGLLVENINNESLESTLQYLDNLVEVAERLNLTITYNSRNLIDEILVKCEKASIESFTRNSFNGKSNYVQELMKQLNELSELKYKKQLIEDMIVNIDKEEYVREDSERLKELRQVLIKLSDIERKELIDVLKGNRFFIPNLAGEITHSKWSYAHSVFIFLKGVQNDIGLTFSIDEICEVIKRDENIQYDRTFAYRLDSLINQYLK